MENYKIDFVIPWVDGSDINWLKEKEKYWVSEGNTPFLDGNESARFRDWDILRYWFRAVEKFTPWVNQIFFVTWEHVPEWLNVHHPKLKIVNHRDYIDSQYLPTFSANPIEINFHNIKDFSEHFVYFNDDMFVIRSMEKSDFFVNGLPREMATMYLLANNGAEDTFQYMLFRMMGEVNKHFDLHDAIRKNKSKWFNLKYKKYLLNNFLLYRFHNVSGLYTPHVPSSLRKSTMKEVWDTIPQAMTETCQHRFRNQRDITQYIFRYWEIMKGTFEPTNIMEYGKEFFVTDSDNEELCSTIEQQKAKLICINDSIQLKEFEKVKQSIVESFEKVLPVKSKYEL